MRRAPLKAVRLTEIPFGQRMTAARAAAKTADDDDQAAEILWAAFFPSNKLYWVRAEPEAVAA